MRTRDNPAIAVAVVAVSVVAVLSGCASTGMARRESVVSSMENARSYVERSKAQVAATMTALNGLPGKSGDALVAQYKQFVSEYGKTESVANDTAKRAAEVRAKGDKQLKTWQEESATLQDPELRRRAEARRAEQAERYDAFVAEMIDTDRSLQTFLADLRDIKTYLDLDLTPRGVESVRDKIARANTNVGPVMQSLDRLNQGLDALSASLRP